MMTLDESGCVAEAMPLVEDRDAAVLEENAVQVKTLGSYPAPGWVEER